jgi:hypothetical protein
MRPRIVAAAEAGCQRVSISDEIPPMTAQCRYTRRPLSGLVMDAADDLNEWTNGRPAAASKTDRQISLPTPQYPV